MTADLEALRDWLRELGVTHVGMESTGVYWKPVHTILEGHFTLIVANAHHIKAVPDRREGCRMDRRPGAPRPGQAEFRAAARDP
jgi:transposase